MKFQWENGDEVTFRDLLPSLRERGKVWKFKHKKGDDSICTIKKLGADVDESLDLRMPYSLVLERDVNGEEHLYVLNPQELGRGVDGVARIIYEIPRDCWDRSLNEFSDIKKIAAQFKSKSVRKTGQLKFVDALDAASVDIESAKNEVEIEHLHRRTPQDKQFMPALRVTRSGYFKVVQNQAFVPGKDWGDFFNPKVSISIVDKLTAFKSLLEDVIKLHSYGVAHLDLHLGNVKVDDKNQAHILDFGRSVRGFGKFPEYEKNSPDTPPELNQILGTALMQQEVSIESLKAVDAYRLGRLFLESIFPDLIIGKEEFVAIFNKSEAAYLLYQVYETLTNIDPKERNLQRALLLINQVITNVGSLREVVDCESSMSIEQLISGLKSDLITLEKICLLACVDPKKSFPELSKSIHIADGLKLPASDKLSLLKCYYFAKFVQKNASEIIDALNFLDMPYEMYIAPDIKKGSVLWNMQRRIANKTRLLQSKTQEPVIEKRLLNINIAIVALTMGVIMAVGVVVAATIAVSIAFPPAGVAIVAAVAAVSSTVAAVIAPALTATTVGGVLAAAGVAFVAALPAAVTIGSTISSVWNKFTSIFSKKKPTIKAKFGNRQEKKPVSEDDSSSAPAASWSERAIPAPPPPPPPPPQKISLFGKLPHQENVASSSAAHQSPQQQPPKISLYSNKLPHQQEKVDEHRDASASAAHQPPQPPH